MQFKYGFLKGLNRDTSPDKYDPNNYFDALNLRVVTDTGLSTGSVTSESGNELLFKVPTTLGAMYTIRHLGVSGHSPFTGKLHIITSSHDIEINVSGWYNISNVYSSIMSNSTVISDISLGYYKVFLKPSGIVIQGLSDLSSVTFQLPGDILSVETSMPQINNPIIVGIGNIRDWLVVFTTADDGTNNGQIWKCEYDKNTQSILDLNVDTLDASIHLVYNGRLNFKKEYRVGEVISRYQDDNNGKVYFVDGLNTLRHINVFDANSMALDLSDMELIPVVNMMQPKPINVIKGGMYKSGMIQYVCQFFNLGGSESAFSSASGLVHLTFSPENLGDSGEYEGTQQEGNTGKAVVVQLDNLDTRFEYVRLVALYYASKEGQPTVNVITERLIPASGTLTITDPGDTVIDVYTPAEYNAYGSRFIIPQTIATKNNYLLAANIKEEYFDLDDVLPNWDARAYRWNLAGSQFKIDGIATSDLNVPETADCIFDEADYPTYAYNTDHNLGGEGPNIKYEFTVITTQIDNNSHVEYLRADAGTKDLIAAASKDFDDPINYPDTTYANTTGYLNYANPMMHSQVLGYRRGERYRFGIVVFDDRGRQSFVKWIADIRMPDAVDTEPTKTTYYMDTVNQITPKTNYATFYKCIDTGSIQGNLLGVKFTVSNLNTLPSGYSYKIVRVRREDNDRSILGQGLVGFTRIKTNDAGTDIVYPRPYTSNAGSLDDSVDVLTSLPNSHGYAMLFKSPEVNFLNNVQPETDDTVKFIYEIDYSSTEHMQEYLTVGANWYDGVKMNKIKGASAITPIENTIVDSIVVKPNVQTGLGGIAYNFNDGSGSRYYYNSSTEEDTIGSGSSAFKGTCLLLGVQDDLIAGLASLSGIMIANIVKNITYSQYGGRGYYERISNIYISCGNVVSKSVDEACVYGGDTFITYFDYLNQIFWPESIDAGHGDDDRSLWENTNVVFVPLESSVCTELRHGSCYSRGDRTYKLNETPADGIFLYPETSALGVYPATIENLYEYNTVYSAEPIAKTYVPKPLYFQNSTTRDYRIVASEPHINGQVTDGWTKFLFNNLIEVNSTYGAINKIVTHKNNVYFFQDNGYGVVSVKERQIFSGENASQLVLGTGGILDYSQYISEKAGCRNKFSVVDSGDALYFYDATNKKFMRMMGGSDVQISDTKGLSYFFRGFNMGTAEGADQNINGKGIHGVFDPLRNRIILTMLSSSAMDATVSYNQLIDGFESFYSYKPNLYHEIGGRVLSVTNSYKNRVYIHNSNDRCKFYGDYYPTEVTILANQQPDIKKVFTNIEYNSVNIPNTYNFDVIQGADEHLNTIDTIKLWNNYQTTGDIALTSSNIRRRFRTWRYQIPRADSGRFIDYHLFIKLSLTNGGLLPGEDPPIFRLEDVIVNHLIPII